MLTRLKKMVLNQAKRSFTQMFSPCRHWFLTVRRFSARTCVLNARVKKSSQPKFKTEALYTNRIERLQEVIQIPILKDGEQLFSPSLDELKQGEQLFRPKPGHDIEYLKGALFHNQLPNYDNYPEVAFAGRSNVGKSSLIRALFCHVPDIDVRISRKPGHTKVLNFFKVGRKFHFVDMPGFGENMPKHFVESVESYLRSRKRLVRTFLLIDSIDGVTDIDLIGIQMMEEYAIPYTVVLTKTDQVTDHILLRQLLKFLNLRDRQLVHCFPQPFLVSSHSGEGVALLQTFIGWVTGKLKINGL